MAGPADGGGDASDADSADSLHMFARTLSVQDGELPPPPSPPHEEPRVSSPFASRASEPLPDDAAAAAAAAAAEQQTRSQAPQANGNVKVNPVNPDDEQDGHGQQDSQQPGPAARAVKRLTPTTERTDSDAADMVRQRVSSDRKGRDSYSGSSAGQRAAKADPQQQGRSSSDGQHPSTPSSEAGDQLEDGDGRQQPLFSTAASEALAAMAPGAAPSWTGGQQQGQKQQQEQQRQQGPSPALQMFWGAAQAQGERDHFEDRYSLQPQLQLGQPENAPAEGGSKKKASGSDAAPAADSSGSWQRCSYAAVFDGHSAADAADMAAKRLHVLLADELSAPDRRPLSRIAPSTANLPCLHLLCAQLMLMSCCASSSRWQQFRPVPVCCSGGQLDKRDVKDALVRTFSAMDGEILADAARSGARCGSTACVALQLGADLYVAHAGDSIAVLDRSGRAEVLTSKGSHKVDTPKESARIKAHGGVVMPGGQRIISPSGRHSLNMARAFGDADYKTPNRIVSAVPDVRHVSIGQQDKAVILASDGLWDVVSESEAVSAVSTSLGGGTAELKARATGDAAESLAHAAADALVGLALKNGTTDNVTVVVGLVRWS